MWCLYVCVYLYNRCVSISIYRHIQCVYRMYWLQNYMVRERFEQMGKTFVLKMQRNQRFILMLHLVVVVLLLLVCCFYFCFCLYHSSLCIVFVIWSIVVVFILLYLGWYEKWKEKENLKEHTQSWQKKGWHTHTHTHIPKWNTAVNEHVFHHNEMLRHFFRRLSFMLVFWMRSLSKYVCVRVCVHILCII